MAIQWHRVFDDALATSDVVAVAVVVTRYLRRDPTRSELHSARRAASSYAQHGSAQLVHVPIGSTRRLLLARPGADVSDSERLHDIAISRAAPPHRRGRARDEQQIAEAITAAVAKAARSARLLDAAKVDDEHAAALMDDLTQPLHDLDRLRQRLRARATR